MSIVTFEKIVADLGSIALRIINEESGQISRGDLAIRVSKEGHSTIREAKMAIDMLAPDYRLDK